MATSYVLEQSRKIISGSAVAPTAPRLGGLKFDWLVILTTMWMVGGALDDAWNHAHIIKLDTFWTWAHATIYSGMLAVGAVHTGVVLLNRQRGYSWKESIPAGYGLSFIGLVLGLLTGVADMTWHLVFGIEQDISAAISPTHMFGTAVIGIMATGPLRAAWRRYPREEMRNWLKAFPAVVSLGWPLMIWTLFTSWSSTLTNSWWVGTPADAFVTVGVVSIMLQGGLLSGFLLFALRRMRLPFGAVTLLFGMATSALLPVQWDVINVMPAILVAGLVIDTLCLTLRPTLEHPWTFRVIGFVAPASYFFGFFITLLLQGQVHWNTHEWFGSAMLAGGVGLLLSCLVIPTRDVTAAPLKSEV